MKFQITPESSLLLSKSSIFFTCCWPPAPNASKFKVLIHDVFSFLAFISAICLLIPLLCSVYQDRGDSLILLKSIFIASGVLLVASKIVICRIHRFRLQYILKEITDFLRRMNERERETMQNYAHKYGMFHIFFTIAMYMGSLVVILGPLLTSTRFPTDAKYPFPIESKPVTYIIYAHQTLCGFQVSAAMSIDCLLGYILWFLAARFELLSQDFRAAKDDKDFRSCVHKHQQLLEYANEVKAVAWLLIFTTFALGACGIVFCGIHLFTPETMIIKIQSIVIVWAICGLLYITSWSAEYVILTSSNIGLEIYNSSWIGLRPGSIRSRNIVLQRAQKPVTIQIGGFMRRLSLAYYAHYLSQLASYLAAVRILLNLSEKEI